MGKFVIKKSKNDQYVFNLLAANNQVICTSETYKAIDGARNGIESVKKNCTAEIEDQTVEGYEAKKNPKYEVYTDKAGETRFRLKAGNGQIVAVSVFLRLSFIKYDRSLRTLLIAKSFQFNA